MKKRISLIRILTATLITFFVTTTAYAGYIIHENSSNFSKSGTMWSITQYGQNGHAYQYMQYTSGNNSYSNGNWYVNSGEPSGTYYWWAYIPYNLGQSDAIIDYQLKPSGPTTVVNQESYANYWVYLGNFSGTSSAYAKMDNNCVGGYSCDWTRQVWWDGMLFSNP